MNTKNSQNYNSIDFFKFIAAILVVMIHTNPFTEFPAISIIASIVTRFAVPFFFISSAFLFFSKEHLDSSYLCKYIRKIFLLYLIWGAIYTPYQVSQNSYSFMYNDSNFVVHIMQLLKIFFFNGLFNHLWYLPALIISISVGYFINKQIKNNGLILILSLSLMLLSILSSTYYEVFQNNYILDAINWFGTRNGIFFGVPFILLGLYISKTRHNNYFSTKKLLLFFLLSFTCLLIEFFIAIVFLKVKSTILWFFLIPTMFFLFKVILEIRIPFKCNFKKLRDFSTSIYTSHYLFIILFNFLVKTIFNGLKYNNLLMFLFTLLLSLLFANLSYSRKKASYR